MADTEIFTKLSHQFEHDESSLPEIPDEDDGPDVPGSEARQPNELPKFIAVIAEYIQHRKDDIIPIRQQQGGWENWLQVELARFFAQQHMAMVVMREMKVYKDSPKRADLLLSIDEGFIVVELKCDSVRQNVSQGKTGLARRLRADIRKINDNELHVDYLPAQVYAIAITCAKSVTEATKKWTHWDVGGIPSWVQVEGTDFHIFWHAVPRQERQ